MDESLIVDIAIVGLGATGVSLLSQIQDEVYNINNAKRPTIAVFNPSSSFASGKAFGDADTLHKVNTPPWMMSVTNMEPDKFGHWLHNKLKQPSGWPARLEYSQFISQAYHDIRLAGILKIHEYKNNVIAINRHACGFSITMEGGNIILGRKVVMCLGAQAAEIFPGFKKTPGFIEHHLDYQPDNQRPLIIAGSGLTAIDAFRYAWAKGKSNIHLYSRRGYAPTCLTNVNNYSPIYLNWRNIVANSEKSNNALQTFTHLLRKEYSALGGKDEFKQAMKLLWAGKQKSYFKYLQSRAENADLPWQDVLVSTRPYMHKLWNAMTLTQRKKFSSEYGALWAAWRHPIPQEVFSEMIQACSDGRLQLHQSISEPKYDNGQFVLLTRQGKISANYFWDATGGSQNLEKMEVPILQSLINNKMVEAHPCGGININPLTYECIVGNYPIYGLYNLGPLSKGCLFSTNAFWFNARCAENWAKQWALSYVNNAERERS